MFVILKCKILSGGL